MAINITTLPSNIGGISVPGAIKGPLSALYESPYNKEILRYPKDLGSNPARKHSIIFTVMENDPANLSGIISTVGGSAIKGAKAVEKESTELANIAVDKNITNEERAGKAKTKIIESAVNISEAGQEGINALTSSTLRLRRKPGKKIGLYIPDNVNVQYSVGYDSSESLSSNLGRIFFLAQGATSLAKAFTDQKDKSIVNMLNVAGNDPFIRDLALTTLGKYTGTNLTRLGLNAAGYAINPQYQVLFQSIGFRTFQFSFLLTPTSKEETDSIKKIIEAFKYHSAPEIASNSTDPKAPSLSYYMKVPDAFDIKFFYGNEENQNVHKIGESVLTDVNVDYAGSGQWSTFNDGAPNQIKLELTFKETVLIDKNKIKQGY